MLGRPVRYLPVACPSGRRSTPRKRVRVQALRGFKSHRHRTLGAPRPQKARAWGAVIILGGLSPPSPLRRRLFRGSDRDGGVWASPHPQSWSDVARTVRAAFPLCGSRAARRYLVPDGKALCRRQFGSVCICRRSVRWLILSSLSTSLVARMTTAATDGSIDGPNDSAEVGRRAT